MSISPLTSSILAMLTHRYIMALQSGQMRKFPIFSLIGRYSAMPAAGNCGADTGRSRFPHAAGLFLTCPRDMQEGDEFRA